MSRGFSLGIFWVSADRAGCAHNTLKVCEGVVVRGIIRGNSPGISPPHKLHYYKSISEGYYYEYRIGSVTTKFDENSATEQIVFQPLLNQSTLTYCMDIHIAVH